MRKFILSSILALVFIFFAFTDYRVEVQPTIPTAKALKGHYAAQLRSEFVTWGGYYRQFNPYADKMQEIYDPYAFGTSLDVPEGGLYLGGRCEPCASRLAILRKDVTSVKYMKAWKYDASGTEKRVLLPFELWRHAATYTGGKIFVAGGLHDSLSVNTKLISMDWPDGKEWAEESQLPDASLVSPLLIPCGDDLLLLGGCKTGCDTLAYETWQKQGWRYDVDTHQWEALSLAELPDSLFPAAGGMSVSVDAFTTAFFGGQERNGRYREHVVIYNRLFNRWNSIPGDSLLARVDAVVTRSDDRWIVSGGEIAQGKNTADVTFVAISRVYTKFYVSLAVIIILLSAIYIMRRRK